MDLDITDTPEDLLMTKFFDCLVLLPNLRTLEIFSTSHNGVFSGLKQRSAQFPSVRELGVNGATVELVWRCPNVESVTIRGALRNVASLESHGEKLKNLKRIVGVREGVVGPGKLKDAFWSGIRSFATHHGSCAVLSVPPRDLH